MNAKPQADPAAPPVGPLRRLLAERGLSLQSLVLGSGATVLAVLAWRGLVPAGELSASAVAVGGAAATLAVWLLVRNTAHRLQALTRDAREIEREELVGDRSVDICDESADLFRLSLGVRRLLAGARRKILALEAQNQSLGRELDVRSHELSTLENLSIGLASKSDLPALVDEALDALGHAMDYASASIWARADLRAAAPVLLVGCRSPWASDAQLRRLVGSRLTRENLRIYESIERERRPFVENEARVSVLSWLWGLLAEDGASAALHRRTRSWLALPLMSRHEVVGVLRVDHEEADHFQPERVKLLAAVASQTATAMRHAELLTRERDVAIAAERNRIARDLHDAVSQTLFAANMVAGSMVRAAEQGGIAAEAMASQARSLEQLNRGALAEMRLLMFELKPDAIEKTAMADLLKHAVEALAGRSEIQITTDLARGEAIDGATRVQIYRMAQEALSNVARHSGAKHLRIDWRWSRAEGAVLQVADDGCGFDANLDHPGHFGLGNLRARADEIGAQLLIDSAPGAGTRLTPPLPGEERPAAFETLPAAAAT